VDKTVAIDFTKTGPKWPYKRITSWERYAKNWKQRGRNKKSRPKFSGRLRRSF